jgi:hypothetical protein
MAVATIVMLVLSRCLPWSEQYRLKTRDSRTLHAAIVAS